MYPVEGSDVRGLADSIKKLASSIKGESELRENELATKTREILALEKANELKKNELEIYSREVLALEKANNIEKVKMNR